MNISQLTVTNFRSYSHACVEFSQGTNILYGDNAQGKTNLLESVYVFCTGRSHRGANNRDMINEDSDFARVDMAFSDGVRSHKGHILIPESGKKSVVINDVPIKKISSIADYINVVMFSPEDLTIIKNEPALRRKFMDMAICQLRPVYLGIMLEYNKVLCQRNAALKAIKRGLLRADSLEVWNEKLAALSARMTVFRSEFLRALYPCAAGIYENISGELLEMSYLPCTGAACGEPVFGGVQALDEKQVYEEISQLICRNLGRDIEMGCTSVGAHHDDFEAYIAGRNVKRFGSQGQQRSVVLSLKLAQTELIKAQKGSDPVILLDDIMSELDSSRRRYLAGKITGKQVILTCTDRESVMEEEIREKVAYFRIADRNAVREV